MLEGCKVFADMLEVGIAVELLAAVTAVEGSLRLLIQVVIGETTLRRQQVLLGLRGLIFSSLLNLRLLHLNLTP